jgi:hypothetical protein
VAFPTFTKDPQAVLDYRIDWSEWLDGDTISTSEWSVPGGLVLESESNTTTAATVWLSGGTYNASYDITNEITTAGGRTDNRTITIKVRER